MMLGFAKRLTHLVAVFHMENKILTYALLIFFLIQNSKKGESLSTKFIAGKRLKQFSYVNQNYICLT